MRYCFIIFIMGGLWNGIPEKNSYQTLPQQSSGKEKAFSVLQTKCNVCHATKKRLTIFTFENMDSLANDINQQVFIKKKMPKGKKVKLTSTEEENLFLWISETKNTP